MEHTFDFEGEWKQAKQVSAGRENTKLRFASIPTLAKVKQTAARPVSNGPELNIVRPVV